MKAGNVSMVREECGEILIGCGCAEQMKDRAGPYRGYEKKGIAERLDDYEGRIEVLEHILDGEENIEERIASAMRPLRILVSILVLLLAIVIIGGLTVMERLHLESEAKIINLQVQIDQVELTQCIYGERYKTPSRSNGL